MTLPARSILHIDIHDDHIHLRSNFKMAGDLLENGSAVGCRMAALHCHSNGQEVSQPALFW